jgi:hypothetical protein
LAKIAHGMLRAAQRARMSYARVQPMLPLSSLEEIVGVKQTRIQTTSSVHRIPTAQAIARASVRALPVNEPVSGVRQSPTFLTQRTRAARRIAWPLFLCGFIAGIFGGLAVVKSPVGKKPVVQHVVKKANAMIGAVVR